MSHSNSHYRADMEIYGGPKPDNHPDLQASRAEMAKHDISVAWRDQCAHLLIPLNQCRRSGFWTGLWPWNCEHERHTYEKCMYKDFKYRRDELDHRLAAKKMENERAQQEAQAAAQKKQQEQEQES